MEPCSSPQNASCTSLRFYYDTTTNCSDTSAWTVNVSATNSCQPTPKLIGGGTAQSSQLIGNAASYVTGTCVASQNTPTFSTPNWNTDVLGCGSAPTPRNAFGAWASAGSHRILRCKVATQISLKQNRDAKTFPSVSF